MTSQKSYVCCFHLQSISIHGLSHVPLVSDKSRLALMTMPGLHLQAASMETVVCQHFSELFLT